MLRSRSRDAVHEIHQQKEKLSQFKKPLKTVKHSFCAHVTLWITEVCTKQFLFNQILLQKLFLFINGASSSFEVFHQDAVKKIFFKSQLFDIDMNVNVKEVHWRLEHFCAIDMKQ